MPVPPSTWMTAPSEPLAKFSQESPRITEADNVGVNANAQVVNPTDKKPFLFITTRSRIIATRRECSRSSRVPFFQVIGLSRCPNAQRRGLKTPLTAFAPKAEVHRGRRHFRKVPGKDIQ